MADSLIDAAAVFTFAVHEALTGVASTQQLSVTQLRVLGILRDRIPSMAELADHLRLDRSSVSGLIDRAEKRGLVVRGTAEHDARVVTVRLTDSGRALGAELEAAVDRGVGELLAAATVEDREALVRIVQAIGRVGGP
ncbi:MarR family winged helix-turn-helix transcriptional regulator [Frondihabitans sp. VKM Ac-2883]|uniref:MarR family winged helix-turn-helix transcriptional regulator n=1 Tax=Frondihabitans sp. VKM Ac-2883 TaxID=2783823 RepID=UPI00188AB256|nr:MarR family transcriptional regulator [Frondihabitans sp. VKM Ac-2883]MBF4576455.1 MarR family transcriptional regulator [Frondihabitans sp. VKM Ac-2883]